ncbi:MAG: restriction endonuclease [Bacteroidetes bacterium]|nr:restriction endonuclease [Bacteroidota bacterium]
MDKKIFYELFRESKKRKWETIDLLEKYFTKKGFINIFKATAMAEKSITHFIEFVNQEINFSSERNIEPLILPTTDESITSVNDNYFIVEKIRDTIVSDVSDIEFEIFCAKLIFNYFNADKYVVTQKGGDGGYDFYIKLLLNNHPLFQLEIYGQAKKWRNKIKRPEIDGFLGAPFNNNINKIHFLVFITTSNFTKDALDYANSNNIICLNGLQISTMIFRTNQKDCINGKIKKVINELVA